jgi:hypothetical protein
MLSHIQEKELLMSLDFAQDDMDILQMIYGTHVGKVRYVWNDDVIRFVACMLAVGY